MINDYCFLFYPIFRAPEDIIWRHADFVLQQNESEGVRTFKLSQHFHGKEHKVMDFLQKYPKAKLEFLQFLVYEKNLKVK